LFLLFKIKAIGVCLLWGKKIKCVIVNVYAPCFFQAKKVLSVDLLEAMKVHMADHYCILGDVNYIRNNRGEIIGAAVRV
jgi:hypothetical protein